MAAALAVGVLALGGAAARAETRLIGSGASFPFPLYSAWFQTYSQATDGVRLDYQAKGSGAGIQDLIQGVTDFGASDAAMSDAEVETLRKERGTGVVMLPMTAGEIVLAYNVPGVEELRLPREVYPAIFAGEITSWNDPAIVAANPDAALPDLPITVVARSDSSGTTFVFTKHLSAVDEAFASTVGEGKTVPWPNLPTFVKAPKNDGITATVAQTPGAIGYIEYGYAKLTGTPSALLENVSGEFVAAGDAAGMAALASAEFEGDDLRVWVTDPGDPAAYPIATFTWMLFYEDQEDAAAAALRDFVEWAVTDGQAMASDLGYIPLPDNVVERVREASADIR
jgi:phosphate transport system substrate-binding protein